MQDVVGIIPPLDLCPILAEKRAAPEHHVPWTALAPRRVGRLTTTRRESVGGDRRTFERFALCSRE